MPNPIGVLVHRRSTQRIAFVLPLVLLTASVAAAQSYDLLLQGGHVIDPANGIDQVMDVAISQATGLPASLRTCQRSRPRKCSTSRGSMSRRA